MCKSGELLVRNQGKCRASYAFAATETIAAINAIYETNFFIPLSAQELISSSLTDTDGCSGSLESAFSYVKLNGVNFEWSYPYKNENSSISLPPL